MVAKMPPECKRACDCCNIRKIRCDGGNPCARCVAAGVACTSLRERKKSGPRNLRQSKTKILKQQSAAFASVTWPSSASTFALDDQPLFTGTVLPAPAWDLHRIALPVLRAVLLLYKEKLYGIWPLLHAEDLIFRLEAEPHDAELYALATALCGATLSYLNCIIANELLPEPLVAEAFVTESRRVRATFNYMEPVGFNTILTSYFLHMYYGKQPSRTEMAAFYVREAITFAQVFGLHNESTYSYPPWTTREQAVMRRLYFLLFMTERYLCIKQGLPTVLGSISLPDVLESDEQYPDVVSRFHNLVTVFSTPGSNFFGKWTSHTSDVSISREQLLLIQRGLQRPMFDANAAQSVHSWCCGLEGLRAPCSDNPIQLVDIVVSQHWVRSLAWKLSVSLGYIPPNATSSGTLSVAYPLEIAADTLRGIQRFPKHAFEVHGPGMEAKMCEIAASLADSISCNTVDGALGMGDCKDTGAKAVLKGLVDRIFETRTMNPGLRDDLAGKVEVVLKCSEIPPNMPLRQEPKDKQKYGCPVRCIY